MGDAALGLAADGFDDAAVEAFDETVGLGAIGSGQPVVDCAFGADEIEEMATGWPIMRLILHVDGEAVGELAAIVGENGVNRMREVSEEAVEEGRRGLGIAPQMNSTYT